MKVSLAASLWAFALAVSCFSSVLGARLKIRLHKDFKMDQLLVAPAPCHNLTEVDRSSLTLYGHLSDLSPTVRFWKSYEASSHLKYFETMIVPGLRGANTIADVFNVLRNGSCLPFLLGGAVRDQFLQRTPNDADVEVDCSMARLMQICLKNWGKNNCYNHPGSRVAHIGNTTVDKNLEIMDVGNTNATFYIPIFKLEYTVDAMAYDTNGNDVVIDLTGTGIHDTCNKFIRIPSVDDSLFSWMAWLENTQGVLYRFWKLRVKGLQAFNSATHNFIVKYTKEEIVATPQSFPAFYCHYVFSSKYDSDKNKCQVPANKCTSGLSSAVKYNKVFAEDLGDFWMNTVVPGYLPNLEDCSSHNMHQM